MPASTSGRPATSARSRPAATALALAALALGGCRDALDGDACLAACERRIHCGHLAEADRASCEHTCRAGDRCDPGAADTCARCLVDTACDELDDACADACVDPCHPGTGGTGGIDGAGGTGGRGGDGGGSGGGGSPTT